MAIKTLVLQGRKDEQVRSYVEPEFKEAVNTFSKEQAMTPSQAMRKLMIDGFRAQGVEVIIK